MVTLSACQTGLGKVLAGEGVMGMSRAFLYAGADSVLISLWNVNDASTAELMKLVYYNIAKGMARDEALRAAKLRLMRGPRTRGGIRITGLLSSFREIPGWAGSNQLGL